MNRAMLKQYTKLVEFLGLVLGPTYEITLHDVHGKNSTIVAIVNGSVSGRDLDSPPTAMALRAVETALAAADLHPALSVAPRETLSEAYLVAGRRVCRG